MILPVPTLVVLQVVILRDGLLVGSEIFFPGRYVVGSGKEADLRLEDSWVEPAHAVLHFEPEKTVVENTSIQAGTFVNGHKISSCEIRPIDEVGFGPYLLKIRVLTQKAEEPAAAESASAPVLRLATPVPEAPRVAPSSGTVLSTRRRTSQFLAAVPFELVDAAVREDPTQNVTVVRAEGPLRLFLELSWNGVAREVRSFGLSQGQVLAGADESSGFPLFGFTLPEEPFVLAQSVPEDAVFRFFVPSSARAEIRAPDEAAFAALPPEALQSEEAGRFVTLNDGDAIRLTEGEMSLRATVARMLPAVGLRDRLQSFTRAHRLFAAALGIGFSLFFAFLLGVGSGPPGTRATAPPTSDQSLAEAHRVPIFSTLGPGANAPPAAAAVASVTQPTAPPTGAELEPEPAASGTVARILARRIGVFGTIDRRGIAHAVNGHLPALQACYGQGLAETPQLKGRLILEWTVSPSGHVSNARTRRSTLQNRSIESCLIQQLKGVQFPPHRGGPAVVSYPFSFEPTQ